MSKSKVSICPQCGRAEVVEIVYGLPGPKLMASATRGEVVLGGCCVTGEDPMHVCKECGSEWAASKDRSTTAISELFAERFAHWEIALPPGAEAAACRGVILKRGWQIRYIFGADEGGKYIEFYAVHRMTSDSHVRTYESGRTEGLETIAEFVVWDPRVEGSEEAARRRYDEHNRRVAEELRTLGLYPDGDINTYLRTHDVDQEARDSANGPRR